MTAEARLGKDAQHRPVVRHHLGNEARDSLLGGAQRQLLEQPRADAAPLIAIGDSERDLGCRPVAQAHIAGESDDPLTVSGGYCANQRPTLDPVGIEVGRDQPSVDCRMTVKSAIETLVGKLGEEADESIDVACRRGAQAQGAAVAQDDVDTFTVDWSALRLLQGRDHQPADLSWGRAKMTSTVRFS